MVRSTTQRLLLPLLRFFSPLWRMCGVYLLLKTSRSISGKSYPLSRHRFCLLNFRGRGLLTTMLSSVSTAAFMSCVLAAVMTTDNGTPFWSVSTCLLVPSLPLSVGLAPVLSPLKVPWWMRCQVTAISIWYLSHRRISQAAWPIVSGILLTWPIPGTSCDRWSRSHTPLAVPSTGILFSVRTGCRQAQFCTILRDVLLFWAAFLEVACP